MALVTAINQTVFALAPGIFGWSRDVTGGYLEAFLLAGAVQVIAAIAIVSLRNRSR